MPKETQTPSNTPDRQRSMFTCNKESWRRLKLHAASQDKKSPQEMLESIMEEWLSNHPLVLEEMIDNKN